MADDSLRNYGLAAPHGPNMTGEHTATANMHDMNMNPTEEQTFKEILRPDDIYDHDGTYWADMKFGRQWAFVNKVHSADAREELSHIGRMIKRDPLSPVGAYVRNMVIPGAGLLLEGYVLFSIGNIKPLFQQAFPACWSKNTVCNKTWTQAVDYLEIMGIIVGQILVGFIGDWIGRRWGLIQDATIMFIGLLMLTASWGTTLNGWVICYCWSLFFYSIGVGGEYPMTATAGMENAVGSGKVSTKDDRLHRGRRVTSAFLMQGWGQLLNQVILIVGLLIFHGSGNPPYSKGSTQYTYRVSFAIPAAGTLWLVYYRIYKMRSASKQVAMAKKKGGVTGYDARSLGLLFVHFGGRLLATTGAWYANDIFFYGNKLFQGEFIKVISPSAANNVMTGWLYNLINVGVSLCGYYLASFLIDFKPYGRKNMMIVGFMMDFILFVVPAFNYKYYTTKAHVHEFQAMYFLSSFFNQFGPNSVTFIVAAEVYPTTVRATAHGVSAACGKMGALTAAVLYNYIDDQTKFYVVPWFGLVGALLTLFCLPDTTGLDLKEQERRWAFIMAGRGSDYHGIAIHPRHISLWERLFGISKNYNPELDYQMRVDAMRAAWAPWQQRQAEEKAAGEWDEAEDTEFSDEVSSYFARTGGKNTPMMTGMQKPVNGDSSEDEKHHL